jgi:PAS domain S-box-containing protein
MAHGEHHEHLIRELAEQLEPVFSGSPQAIYLYLDDEHKTCNKKFSDMLGYKSVDEWVANEFPVSDVLEADQKRVINAYMNASRKLEASSVLATMVTKDGNKIKCQVILAPLSYKGETFVLHFISEEK